MSGYCDATYNTQLDPADARPCSRHAKQACANCDAKLCDLHAEFCAICLAFFCEGCLDLHNEEGQHADGTIGDLVACVTVGSRCKDCGAGYTSAEWAGTTCSECDGEIVGVQG